MGTTPKYGFRYDDLTSAPNGAGVTQRLASDVESTISRIDDPPRCHAYRGTTPHGTTSGVWSSAISLSSEEYDAGADSPHHDTGDLARVYIRVPGLYVVQWGLCFEAVASNVRLAEVRVNAGGSQAGGTQVSSDRQLSLGGSISVQLGKSCDWQFEEDDYIELFGMQNSGSDADVLTGKSATFLQIRWVSE